MAQEIPDIGAHYLEDVALRLQQLKQLAERAMAQAEADFFTVTGPEDNSLAVIVKHLAGNMRSRWEDLSADGESPTRRRDEEFVIGESKAQLLEHWERSWALAFRTLEEVTPADLLKTLTIRGEPHSYLQALQRLLAHNAYHVGQMVFLAKHFAGESWQSLSIPRGASEAFNAQMAQRAKKG